MFKGCFTILLVLMMISACTASSTEEALPSAEPTRPSLTSVPPEPTTTPTIAPIETAVPATKPVTEANSELDAFLEQLKTAVQIFDWDPARFGGTTPSPIWSSDGQWLALEVLANGPEGSGIWLLASDGSSQTYVDSQGHDPYWANDTQLVYGVNDGPRLYNLPSGETFRVGLPAGSWVLGVTPLVDLLARP